MHISQLDHIVLTVADVEAASAWYARVLGMSPITFGDRRQALTFGTSKINLHQAGNEIRPHAATPLPGSADLCLISAVSLDEVRDHLLAQQVQIEEGPVPRTGATGAIDSIYLRDLDGNLIEISRPVAGRPRAPHPYDLLPPVAAFTLTSDDFGDGEQLPMAQVHGSAGGQNLSPQLSWSGFPEQTKGFALTCFDPDAPTGSGFWHWLVARLPVEVTSLTAGAGVAGDLGVGALQLRGDFGSSDYAGAAPPPGDPAHRYIFAVHALDTDDLGLDDSASAAFLGFNLHFHTVARATLMASWSR